MAVKTGSAIEAKLQKLVDGEMRKKHTHTILLSVQSEDKSLNFQTARGTTDAAQKQPVRVDSPYFIASTTKLFTVAALLQLQDRGLLHMDDPIDKVLPASLVDGIHVHEGTDYSHQLKIWQLMSHTSGVADYFEDPLEDGKSMIERLQAGEDRAWSVQEVVEIARTLEPKFAPNPQKVHYSDTNYQLLGVILETVTGKTAEENFREMIYEPLGLQQTAIYNHAQPRAEDPVIFYHQDSALNIPLSMSSFGVDGGIVSTMDDMLRFLRGFMGGELFDPQHFSRMSSQWNMLFPPMIQYGYGMMRVKVPRIFSPFKPIPELLGHSGASGSLAFYSPEQKVYIVGSFNQIDNLSRPYRFLIRLMNAIS